MLKLTIFCQEGIDLEIVEVYGRARVKWLEFIEKELNDGSYSDLIRVIKGKTCLVKVKATWIDSETQYGSGHGDVYHLPGYFDLDVLEIKELKECQEEAKDQTQD